MPDRAVPTLPSRSLNATAAFYAQLGFDERYRDDVDLGGTLLRLIEN